jgi:hypothetical protein
MMTIIIESTLCPNCRALHSLDRASGQVLAEGELGDPWWVRLFGKLVVLSATGQQARSTPSRAHRSNRAATRKLDLFPEADIQSWRGPDIGPDMVPDIGPDIAVS